jgi:DNA-directed RNA polymerase specialized sigma24 family protein
MNDNYSDLLEAAQKISRGDELAQELLHYALEQFLGREDVLQIVSSGGARYFIVRIMLNQWNSKTSYFYNNFRKPSGSLVEDMYEIAEIDESTEEVVQKITKILSGLSWYNRLLFDTYVQEGHSVSSLSRVTKIPRTSVSLSINRIRKHVKKNL